jgi:acetyl-CoA carboxylase carboxyltransferase component
VERLSLLCDPGSIRFIRSDVSSRFMAERARPGDGVVGGSGYINGRRVFCYAQDPSYLGGSLGEAHAETIVRVLDLAARARVPVVGFVSSGGARLQEGVAGLAGYGRIFRRIVALSGVVPMVTVVTGLSAGGGAYSPALTDWVVMTDDSSLFLTGPSVVREVLGEEVTATALGGPRVQQQNGVCHFVRSTDAEASYLVRELLGYLPDHSGGRLPTAPYAQMSGTDPGECVPVEPRRVYDVRDVIRRVVDRAELLEVGAGWARNIVTSFARIEGRPVGVIANQPRRLGGVLDAASSEKAARFVSKCDAFGVPLVVFVDTPGFMPGSRQESIGVIRYGATLVHAFARATVPRVTVILRKAFGGAFIAMNSKELGADHVFAWPQAQIGVMGARPAVAIIHSRLLAAAEDREAALEKLTADHASEHLGANVAARDGYIDEVIRSADTRDRLAHALGSLLE